MPFLRAVVVMGRYLRIRGTTDRVPQEHGREATLPHGKCGGHHFRFGRAMTNTALPFADPRKGLACVWANHGQVHAGRGAFGVWAPGKVGVSEEVQSGVGDTVPNPSHHALRFCGVDIANQTVEPSVALGRPLCDEARQMTDRPE